MLVAYLVASCNPDTKSFRIHVVASLSGTASTKEPSISSELEWALVQLKSS